MELPNFWIMSDRLAVADNELSIGGVGQASALILTLLHVHNRCMECPKPFSYPTPLSSSSLHALV